MASPPFPLALNRLPLFLSRLDIYAGEIKTQKPEPTSVRASLTLLVPSGKRYEELYKLQDGSPLEIGPFQVRQQACLQGQTDGKLCDTVMKSCSSDRHHHVLFAAHGARCWLLSTTALLVLGTLR